MDALDRRAEENWGGDSLGRRPRGPHGATGRPPEEPWPARGGVSPGPGTSRCQVDWPQAHNANTGRRRRKTLTSRGLRYRGSVPEVLPFGCRSGAPEKDFPLQPSVAERTARAYRFRTSFASGSVLF